MSNTTIATDRRVVLHRAHHLFAPSLNTSIIIEKTEIVGNILNAKPVYTFRVTLVMVN